MDAERIKWELKCQGWTVQRLAGQLGVCKQTVSRVLHGKRSHRVEAFIAQVLGKPLGVVWPERYSSDKESV